ncbi:MAG: GTPase [Planctomycetota bacterium]|jgi:ribosome-interacting GTPase 1
MVYIFLNMPTNVPPEYRKAEEAYRAAKTADEKLERLEDMIALLPKHKGTEHLYADLKRRVSALKKQLESGDKKSRHGSFVEFVRQGAAQVILIGPPNSGKSSILKVLTKAHPEVGDYPFTTNQMQPGMAVYEDIQIQLVDTPPVTAEFIPRHLLGIVRKSDGVLLVADMSNDSALDDIDAVFEIFSARHVRFVREKEPENRDSVLCRVIANKMDVPGSNSRLELLQQMLGDTLDIYPLTSMGEENVSQLPAMIFNWLKIVRVYTKAPGEKARRVCPHTVFAGQSVSDICELVHKDFFEKLRFARLWRGSEAPVTVSRNELVKDGDMIELHI